MTRPTVYVSGPVPSLQAVKDLIAVLEARGFDCSPTQWVHAEVGYKHDMTVEAVKDFEDVRRADIFVQLNGEGSRGGMFSELGIALAYDKPCYLFGDRTSLMHWHPKVTLVSRVADIPYPR